ncbi:agmatine deiminase [Luminiphilus syltensis NOR5-1B]|uniref:Agmatine deiminase n=2 Tax=Luminiphilus TaxID=1341118 RepID=B8KVI2_9GAMM|nr:agmatine deiminase [Luminiphilus syltensis NOR5-1B]
MPAEWTPHERCWMAWPCREAMWHDFEATCGNYAAVAQAIARFEPLTMVVPPRLASQARDYLGSDIELLELPIDDSWARDSGPNFVINAAGDLAGVCFRFNAWGEKYSPYDQDALLAPRILDHLGVRAIASELIAEGGGICVDGEGTLLTTDTCFPHQNRNPDWSRDRIEAELMEKLGVSKVIWLPGDPLDNETDGHIDGIATFAGPGKIIVESSRDASDPRKPYFDSLRDQLAQETDARGRRFELLTLPEAPEDCALGERFCLSYVNFYYANGAVIAPSYGIPTDDEVRERLQTYFPDREIAMVPVTDIAIGGGGIHCITQQQPLV